MTRIRRSTRPADTIGYPADSPTPSEPRTPLWVLLTDLREFATHQNAWRYVERINAELRLLRAEAAEPAALDVERVKRAIFIVADNEEYDLQYTKEVHRLANDVAARLQSPTHKNRDR